MVPSIKEIRVHENGKFRVIYVTFRWCFQRNWQEPIKLLEKLNSVTLMHARTVMWSLWHRRKKSHPQKNPWHTFPMPYSAHLGTIIRHNGNITVILYHFYSDFNLHRKFLHGIFGTTSRKDVFHKLPATGAIRASKNPNYIIKVGIRKIASNLHQ